MAYIYVHHVMSCHVNVCMPSLCAVRHSERVLCTCTYYIIVVTPLSMYVCMYVCVRVYYVMCTYNNTIVQL